MNTWIYKNKKINQIEDLPQSEILFAFIYKIVNITNGRYYIGYKNFYSRTNKPLGKKELPTDKRKKLTKLVIKESSWKSYFGSNDLLKTDVITLGKHMFRREMIALAYSQKERTFLEIEHQILNNVLRSDNCYNDNINGKFFKRDLIKK